MPPLTENGKMLKIFNQFGIPALNKEKNKALFNNEKANTVLLFWKELYDKKLIPSESLTTTHREMLEKFQAGETAFIVAGPNLIFQIKENSPELYSWLDVSEQLTGDSKKADFSLMNLVIPLKSKHPREALDFALFLTNAENQLNFCKLAPIIPSEKNALSSEYYNHAQKGDLMAKSRIISAHQLKNPLTTLPFLVNQKELNEIIDIMTQKVLLNKESSSDALRNAQIEWDNILMEN
jgi:putative chitobiose transport system substrate-binding protein